MRDLTGERYGRLVAIKRNWGRERCYWLWRCDCGNEQEIYVYNVLRGRTVSCGCVNTRNRVTHGKSQTRVWHAWLNMIQRCTNPNRIEYPYYGARGITVCEHWRKFENFYEDMGDPPDGMSLDRIDPHGNYEPGNVRWATREIQDNNRTNNRLFTMNGITKTREQWRRQYGIPHSTLKYRLAHGWSIERALGIA